jgi:hypothetical protein
MGKCPAPCDGSIPLEMYRESIAAALGFALGERELTYARLTTAMREAASAQSYERAAVLKKQIERARWIEHPAFSRVRRMPEFNYLVVQRGAGTTRLRAFYVHEGVISPAGEVKRTHLADALPQWIEQLHHPAPAAPIGARSEQIWLVSHFLFKPDAPGIYLHISELSDLQTVLQRVQERFARTSPASVQDREGAHGQHGPQNEQEATEETELL